MSYPFYLFFALIPSLIWLLVYLKKDVHPESKRMVVKIFFWGMLAVIPTALLQLGILKTLAELNLPLILLNILNIFIAVALVEEFFKYLVVEGKVLSHPEFDEPVDVMIYMIIAALGFAAAENILALFSLGPVFFLDKVITISFFRFWGAVFLHALCSGLFGYFLALSIFETKKRGRLLILGAGLAALLHGLYNFFIIKLDQGIKIMLLEEDPSFLITIAALIVVFLISLAIIVAIAFKRLKKLKSVCKI